MENPSPQLPQSSAHPHDAHAHDSTEARWLSADEQAAWLSLWTTTVWLPTRLDQQMRRDAGLSLVEYHSLSQIDMSPERTLRLSELASVTNMSLSHLSRVVTRLENAGLLRREPDPSDGRSTLAILTDAGHDRVVAARTSSTAWTRSRRPPWAMPWAPSPRPCTPPASPASE
jgi:DNA-binding MarR family transcriptional regulator